VYLVRDREKTHSESLLTAVPSTHGLLDLEPYTLQADGQGRKIFLVHGHADEPRQSVSTFLRAVGLEVVVLHEQANQGQTIIEKLEHHSDVAFAVVLLTPDDVGASVMQPEKRNRRARQNVILELGYFMAKLGRKRVCCLYAEGVELPSDYHGVLYVPYDPKGAWRWKLAKELSATGIEVDSQKLSLLSDWDSVAEIFAGISRYSAQAKNKR
jgi:predicted nucleotide-binding protein